MRVSYKGTDSDFGYRVAEIGYDDENPREVERLAELADIMSKDYGWEIDFVGCGYASCEVDDYDDYRSFMEDWREAKRKLR